MYSNSHLLQKPSVDRQHLTVKAADNLQRQMYRNKNKNTEEMSLGKYWSSYPKSAEQVQVRQPV